MIVFGWNWTKGRMEEEEEGVSSCCSNRCYCSLSGWLAWTVAQETCERIQTNRSTRMKDVVFLWERGRNGRASCTSWVGIPPVYRKESIGPINHVTQNTTNNNKNNAKTRLAQGCCRCFSRQRVVLLPVIEDDRTVLSLFLFLAVVVVVASAGRSWPVVVTLVDCILSSGPPGDAALLIRAVTDLAMAYGWVWFVRPASSQSEWPDVSVVSVWYWLTRRRTSTLAKCVVESRSTHVLECTIYLDIYA